MSVVPGQSPLISPLGDAKVAGQRLLETYAALAAQGKHLLHGLLDQPPRQWQHYPEDDAIDPVSGYQWFYHSHSPDDRPGTAEHGHFHLFARRRLWARRLQSTSEKAFASLTGYPNKRVNTRHLISVSLDAKGIPISVFTVNSWVTGDLMLSAELTLRLLAQMQLNTGYPEIDAVLECVIALYQDENCQLLATRDAALSKKPPLSVLTDNGLELLSEITIALDLKLLTL